MPSGPPFSLMPASSVAVPPIGTTKVTATCSPTAAGTFMTTIAIEAADAFASPPVMLAATCEGSTDPLYGTPTALGFGEVRMTAGPVTKTVMLQAATGPQLTLSGQPALESTNSNIVLGALSAMTTPATFDVTIDPAVEADLTEHILISTSDQTLRIPITGRVVKPAYSVPPVLDIGTFCINQPTTQSSLALQSTGTATIGLDAPVLANMSARFDLSPTSPASYPTVLAPGEPATVAITPHPQQSRTTLTDTITWTTDVETAPTATTQLTASFIDSGGAIAPPALDFGKVIVHLSDDNGQRVVIQNCNGSALMLDAPTIKAPFSIDSPNIPSLLNPNETATFSIGFHPTRLGTFTGALLISSQQLATPLMVSLAGEGIPGNPSSDAGSGTPPHPADTGCGCHASGVGGTAPALVVVVVVLVPLRRRRIRYAR
jgi:MYXO-CTERM domain-containing protein